MKNNFSKCYNSFIFSGVALILMFASCESPTGGGGARTYTVSGTVKTGGGESGAGAAVELWPDDGSGEALYLATAGQDGVYTVKDVAAGTYTIKASLSEYNAEENITVPDEVEKELTLTKSEDNGAGDETEQTDDESGASQNGTESGASQSGSGTDNGSGADNDSGSGADSGSGTGSGFDAYTVSGAITGSGNQPIVGAQVVLVKSGGTETFGSPSTTGAEGTYSIDLSGISPGQWVVKVSCDGYNNKESPAFEVTGEKNIIQNLSLATIGYTVSGVITKDIPAGPAAGAAVRLVAKNGSPYAATTANDNGWYSIGDVPTESGYYIEATLDGYDYKRSDSFNVNTVTITQNLTLNKTGGEDEDPTPAQAYYSVSGVISTSDGVSASGAEVSLSGSTGIAPVSAGGAGAYTISNVPAGTTCYVMAYLAGYEYGSTAAFTVSGNISDKNIELQKTVLGPVTYTISGKVTTSDGVSAWETRLLLMQGNTAAAEMAMANSSGEYTISNVPAGTYTLLVTHPGYAVYTASSFTVSGNVTGKNIALTKLNIAGYTANGYISLKTGEVAVGTKVGIYEVGGQSGALAETTTLATGYYIVTTSKAAAGYEYKVRARTTGTPYPTDSASIYISAGVPYRKDVQEKY